MHLLGQLRELVGKLAGGGIVGDRVEAPHVVVNVERLSATARKGGRVGVARSAALSISLAAPASVRSGPSSSRQRSARSGSAIKDRVQNRELDRSRAS